MKFFWCLALGVAILCDRTAFADRSSSDFIRKNTFNYIGQPGSQALQLVVLGGYRVYEPRDGRFAKQDSYTAFRSNRTLNGFNYAAGNPILLTDATGHVFGFAGVDQAIKDLNWLSQRFSRRSVEAKRIGRVIRCFSDLCATWITQQQAAFSAAYQAGWINGANVQVTESNAQLTASNDWATELEASQTDLKIQLDASKARVAELEAQLKASDTQLAASNAQLDKSNAQMHEVLSQWNLSVQSGTENMVRELPILAMGEVVSL